MRSFRFVLSCFNFLAHLLCALVIYLLSKLCCNKILTICFISSDLHRLPCLSFLYAAFPFLIYFILFDSVVFALVSPISIYSLYLALAALCIVHSFASRFFITRTLSPSWSINWWYCGNIEMSVFISFLVFFIPISRWHLTSSPRVLCLVVTLFDAFFYTWWSVRKVLIIRILWVPTSKGEREKKIVRTYQMELHVHMFVQKIAFSNIFLSFVIHEPKSDYLHSLSTLSLSHSLPLEPTLTHSI